MATFYNHYQYQGGMGTYDHDTLEDTLTPEGPLEVIQLSGLHSARAKGSSANYGDVPSSVSKSKRYDKLTWINGVLQNGGDYLLRRQVSSYPSVIYSAEIGGFTSNEPTENETITTMPYWPAPQSIPTPATFSYGNWSGLDFTGTNTTVTFSTNWTDENGNVHRYKEYATGGSSEEIYDSAGNLISTKGSSLSTSIVFDATLSAIDVPTNTKPLEEYFPEPVTPDEDPLLALFRELLSQQKSESCIDNRMHMDSLQMQFLACLAGQQNGQRKQVPPLPRHLLQPNL